MSYPIYFYEQALVFFEALKLNIEILKEFLHKTCVAMPTTLENKKTWDEADKLLVEIKDNLDSLKEIMKPIKEEK